MMQLINNVLWKMWWNRTVRGREPYTSYLLFNFHAHSLWLPEGPVWTTLLAPHLQPRPLLMPAQQICYLHPGIYNQYIPRDGIIIYLPHRGVIGGGFRGGWRGNRLLLHQYVRRQGREKGRRSLEISLPFALHHKTNLDIYEFSW